MNLSVLPLTGRFRNVFFSVALLVLLAACNDDDDFITAPVEVAYVSLYHAAPTIADLDVVVDGRRINARPIEYGSWSGYLNFFTGNRAILFESANTADVLIDTTFSFEDNKAYSLFATESPSGPQALLVVDSAGNPGSGEAMVRFIHLSPDAPAVDVALNETGAIFADRDFKSASDFVAVDRGEASLRVADEDGNELVQRTVDLTAGGYYTVVLQGLTAPAPGEEPRDLELKVLH